jgi:hypothetical protein
MNWNTALVSNGTHSLTARARDSAGNQAFSSAVTVQVSNLDPAPPSGEDTTPPSVTTTGPANGSTVSSTVSVTAQASDAVGVVGVRFFVDGQPIGQEDTSAPYAVSWNSGGVADGSHILTARARDAAGNQTFSAGVGIVVSNAGNEEEPAGDEAPEAAVGGDLDLSISSSSPGFRKIRASANGAGHIHLYVDNQQVFESDGPHLEFDWDVRSLIGSHDVVAVATGSGQTVASTRIFYTLSSTRAPSVAFEVVQLPLIKATLIKASADVAGALRLELYVDGTLRVSKSGASIEHAWDPQGIPHDIVFAVYDALGVVASVSSRYEP